jgi:lipoprotein-anchoring transpeptidase ErfK/SrfK
MSMNLTDPKFNGEKKIIVSLSSQKMQLKLGQITVKTFPVSTGTNTHPTPVGTTKISLKQNVRVAGSSPHYIMPLFMQFRKGGYGIHALPSLGNDHGVYWREALNHIGTRRSHGCIRLLPADAEFAYSFADVGTEVQVVW